MVLTSAEPESSAIAPGPGGARYDIAFGFDRAYAAHGAAQIKAITRYAPHAAFRFIVLGTGLDENVRKRLERCSPTASFVWIEVRDEDIPAFTTKGHLNRSTLFRLGLEKLAPADCRKVLYLDVDLAIVADVTPLWSIELDDCAAAAVPDCWLDPAAFAEQWGLPDGGHYLNGGVILLDLARIREDRLFTQAIALLAEHGSALAYNDQDAMNYVLWKRWKRLDGSWNVQRWMAMKELSEQLPSDKRLSGPPRIIHFTGPEKPWSKSYFHPWAWLYWRSLAETDFLTEVAAENGVSAADRFRLWLRWLRRRP